MSAQMGVTMVEIGLLAWVGLALGAIVGVVVGILIYSGRIALPGVALALASGAVASVVFIASLSAIAGALIGALLHLFRAPAPAPGHEVRVVVEDARADVQQRLVNAGALDVLVPGDGAAQPGNGHHQHASASAKTNGSGHH